MTRFVFPLAAAGLFATTAIAAAQTTSSYDGTWVVDLPAAGFIPQSDDYTCPALRLPIRIVDGQIEGELQQVATRSGDIEVTAGHSNVARPVTGTVAANGTFDAQWEAYHAAGQLGPQYGRVTIKGECGPRTGTAIRITAANPGTEGAGSSLPPGRQP